MELSYILREFFIIIMNIKGNEELIEQQTRLITAKAEMQELKNAEKKRELIPIAEMNKQINEMIQNVKAKILAWPSKLAPQVINKSAREAEAIIKAQAYEILKELADGK